MRIEKFQSYLIEFPYETEYKKSMVLKVFEKNKDDIYFFLERLTEKIAPHVYFGDDNDFDEVNIAIQGAAFAFREIVFNSIEYKSICPCDVENFDKGVEEFENWEKFKTISKYIQEIKQ